MAIINTSTVIDKSVQADNDKKFYATKPDNWFTAKPYGFRITFSDGKANTMFLPISPSNLTISTNFATNMVPTLYGTVEEHSDVRYFDIVIEGTTGIAPQFTAPYSTMPLPNPAGSESVNQKIEANNASLTETGRQSFSITKALDLGGFFSKTLGALSQIKNKALDAIDGSNKPNDPAFAQDKTGYFAFHNLYKMLLLYKKDASGNNGTSVAAALGVERKIHPIVFFNYKDGNQYNVVIRNFTMRRSADNPMLYYYSITMRGYSLRGLTTSAATNEAKKLEDLGLNGVNGSSLLGDIKQRANSVKGVLGAAVGGINVLGR